MKTSEELSLCKGKLYYIGHRATGDLPSYFTDWRMKEFYETIDRLKKRAFDEKDFETSKELNAIKELLHSGKYFSDEMLSFKEALSPIYCGGYEIQIVPKNINP